MEDLNDLLSGGNAAQHLFAERFLSYARDEFLRDLKVNVGFEQREPDLSQRVVDVLLGDRAMTAQVLENILQLIAELGKHGSALGSARVSRVGFGVAPRQSFLQSRLLLKICVIESSRLRDPIA